MAQKIRFMKNVTITGGMLMAWAFGPVRFSLDRDEPALAPPRTPDHGRRRKPPPDPFR